MIRNALGVLSLLAVPAATLAAGGGTHEGDAISPFAGDLGNVIWTLVIFALVVFVLGKFAWGPILGALQKREDFIRNSLKQAKKDRREAETKLKDYMDKLAAAKAEATAIVEEGRRDAEEVKRKIEADGRKESEAMIKRAKREISIATETAVKTLYDLSGKLATDMASRIIRKELDPKDHERLIAESIEELSRVGRN